MTRLLMEPRHLLMEMLQVRPRLLMEIPLTPRLRLMMVEIRIPST